MNNWLPVIADMAKGADQSLWTTITVVHFACRGDVASLKKLTLLFGIKTDSLWLPSPGEPTDRLSQELYELCLKHYGGAAEAGGCAGK